MAELLSGCGLVASLQVLCGKKGEEGRLGWSGLVALLQGADKWGLSGRLHCQVKKNVSSTDPKLGKTSIWTGLPSQVADLIVGRMAAAQTEGEEERTGEILLLLDK